MWGFILLWSLEVLDDGGDPLHDCGGDIPLLQPAALPLGKAVKLSLLVGSEMHNSGPRAAQCQENWDVLKNPCLLVDDLILILGGVFGGSEKSIRANRKRGKRKGKKMSYTLASTVVAWLLFKKKKQLFSKRCFNLFIHWTIFFKHLLYTSHFFR